MALAPISAKSSGEAYTCLLSNWPASCKQSALKYAENGILNCLGNGDTFNSVLSACYTGKIGIAVFSPWFSNFEAVTSSGIVSIPDTSESTYPIWHCYEVTGQKTINGIPYLSVKSWQGANVGNAGELYFSQEVVNAALSVSGAGAYTFNPQAIRWISLIGILANRFPQILPLLPQLLALN